MKKTGRQKDMDLGKGPLIPELKDEKTAEKLGRAYELREAAKEHNKAMGDVRDAIKGFIVGLSAKDQAVGKVRIGDYTLPFSITEVEEKTVEFPASKKISIKFKPEKKEEE